MPGDTNEALVVGLKIVAMFLVIAVGYFCHRRGLLDSQTTPALSRFCTDITLPALILMQLVETVDLATLRVSWTVPLLAVAGTCIGFVIGWLNWRMFAAPSQRPVFIFGSGISNWVYLPLPIAAALYGSDGMKVVFLCSLGIQPLFWTLGVAILHGGHLDRQALLQLARNPGLIATLAGIAMAIVRGLTGTLFSDVYSVKAMGMSIDVIADGLRLLGQATIPLSLVVTGAQIANATMVQNRPIKALLGLLVNRLAIAPALCIAMLWGFQALYPVLSTDTLLVIAIVLLMPISVTATVLTEKMNQDTALAAQGVLYTTLASIATVPLMVILARFLLG